MKGRHSKLTKVFLKATEEVLSEGLNSVILTDEELISEINKKLEPEQRIKKRTFENWKAGTSPNTQTEEMSTFRKILREAIIKQKKDLFQKLLADEKGWTRFAWIIERKFPEWNIRNKIDMTLDTERIVGFNFVAPSEITTK